MSQDTDICENPYLENASDDHLDPGERNSCPCQAASESGRISFPQSDQTGYGKSNVTCKSLEGVTSKVSASQLFIFFVTIIWNKCEVMRLQSLVCSIVSSSF